MKLIILTLILFTFPALTAAQSFVTPDKGSPERKAILDTLRVPVEKQLKQKIVFEVADLRVTGNWAFLSGEPQAAGGGQPDYSGTTYQEAKAEGMFDNNIFALFKRSNGKWRVVTHALGCTDVCYLEWQGRYKAPKSIFPGGE